MTDRIQQVVLRSSMRIVAANARVLTRLDALVGGEKLRRVLVMALGAERAAGHAHQARLVGAVGIMAAGAILSSWLMQGTVTPVLRHFGMAAKAERRLPLAQVAGISGAVPAVTGDTVALADRIMLEPVLRGFRVHIVMAIEADLARLADDEVGLVGAMRAMARHAIALGKGIMCGLFLKRLGQLVVAGQAEGAVIECGMQEAGLFATMRGMTAGAFAAGKRPVLAEQPYFAHCLVMAAETHLGFSLDQQTFVGRLV